MELLRSKSAIAVGRFQLNITDLANTLLSLRIVKNLSVMLSKLRRFSCDTVLSGEGHERS